jgi:uncharacterized protein involved in exopolysaccharide biosynthesis
MVSAHLHVCFLDALIAPPPTLNFIRVASGQIVAGAICQLPQLVGTPIVDTSSPRDEITVADILKTLTASWALITIVTAMGTLLFVVYVVTARPIYRAEALVQIRQEAPGSANLHALTAQLGGLSDLAYLSGGSSNERSLALATLKSRILLQELIRERNLLPALFPDRWDTNKIFGQTSGPPTLWHGYKKFTRDILSVSEEKKTGLVTIAVEWHDGLVAAEWAADIIARTNRLLRDRAVSEGERNLSFLENYREKTSLVEIQRAIHGLVEAELKKLMLAKARDEYALKIVDPPQAPSQPTWPLRTLIISLGFLFSLGISLAVVLLRSTIRSAATR